MIRPSSPRTARRPARRLVAAGLVAASILLAACGNDKPGSVAKEPDGTVAGADKLQPCPSVQSRQPAPRGLPEISLPCLGKGPDTHLSDLRGPLVINVWAQWCGPCREEAPFLADLQRRAGDKLELIGIDYVDTRPDLAVAFAIDQDWSYPHLVDADKQTQQPLRIGGPPVTAFIDAQGAVVHVHRGALTSQQQLDQLVQDKLGVSP
ncbi:TlpA family protein disulfide reductase [Kribbella sp. CA-293567]|uniref:TlpA family protein disulfide reductase n=1 Tax=Kribbella sp. CA-293567 TaxID=3002436 RepID=UPI0022DDA5EA|nr:TlpA disulfide reductase family protein [Kribbella sp. CA-293567]WBQ04980.1 TlpA disulfide reductase family protein [Kribbella sp. CA-293567]